MFTKIITFLIFFAVIGCILHGRKLIKTERVDAVFGNPERAKGGTHWVIVGSSFLLLTWLYYSWDIAKAFYPKSANELCQVAKVNDSLLSLKYLFPIEQRELKRQKNWAQVFTVILKTENDAKNILKTLKHHGRKKHAEISRGHLSWLTVVREGNLMKQLNSAVFKGGVGVVGPIQFGLGFLVSHVVDYYPAGSIAGLDEVYDKIVSMLYLAKRRKKFKALIDRLSAKADIYINKPFLGEE